MPEVNQYVRFQKNPPEKKPPPKGQVDIYFDPTSGELVKQTADGTETNLEFSLGTTAPTNATAATLTTGTSNAAVKWTAATAGSAGNDITVVTTDAAESAVTSAAEVGGAVTITRAAKARMVISADFGSGLEEDVELAYAGGVNGEPSWSSGVYLLSYDGSSWVMDKDGTMIEATTSDRFPDSVDTVWPLTNGETPTVTALSSSASQVKDAADASLTIVDATLPGTGAATFAAVNPAESLTGGTDTTESPPYLRVADGKLYVQEAGVWKQVALSALS